MRLLIVLAGMCRQLLGVLREFPRPPAGALVAAQAGVQGRQGAPESVIQSLQRHTCTSDSARVGETCSICLGEFEAGDSLKTVPGCTHFHHAACLDEWLRIRPLCPLCKTTVETETPPAAAAAQT